MNQLEAALRRITEELGLAGRRWALVGGLAVGARAEPRTTRDVDVAVSVADDADAEAFIHALQSRGFRLFAAIEQRSASRLATARLIAPGANERGVVVDVLFASSGIEREICERADSIEILPGLHIPVACIGHLMALKVLARDDRSRPQDVDDLRALLREADEADLAEARGSLARIEERGFHRQRQLVRAFDTFLHEERT